MRKFLSFGIVLVLSVVSAVVPADAAVKIGDSCKSAGQTTTVNGSVLTCTKSGAKLIWSKSVKADSYDAAFAAAILSEAQEKADQVLADAEFSASQISSPPNCVLGSSRALVTIGGDPSTGVIALIYENPGICDLVVRASAEFYCPRGRSGNNTVISRATFALKARAKIYVSLSPERYFPMVIVECRQLTGYTSNTISVANELTRRSNPTVNVESSKYSGVFNQAEATKKANQILKSAQSRAKQIIADAKNPVLIAKAWKGRAAKEKAAADKIAAEKIAAEKAAAEKAAAVYLVDWRFNYNAFVGGFTAEQRSDGSAIVQCRDGISGGPKWNFPVGLNLEGARLLVTGSRETDEIYSGFILSSFRVKNTLVPVERIKVLGVKWGKDYEFELWEYNLKEIVGKQIRFSTNESICGLTTEPLSDLKTTFASDIQTAALVLLIKPDQNPERIWAPGNQAAILIGSFKILSAADKAAADKAAADKAAADKAAADKAAADKAAADKAAADKAAADKAAADEVGKECRPVNCPLVGSVGPGGGVVFYDAGSYQSWGRYLEFAPNGWSGKAFDPNAIWCNVTNVNFSDLISDATLRASVGVEIGKGKANTNLMLAGCSSGAANLATSFTSGGKNDWYLPSKDELRELCKFVLNNPRNDGSLNWKSDVACQTNNTLLEGFLQDNYWSSSEGVFDSRYPGVWVQSLSTLLSGGGSPREAHSNISGKGDITLRVRPIRAF
jgi:hypothetical protein